jgi:hypothetical protein
VDVLTESGMEEDEIRALIEANVVHVGGSVAKALAIPYR